MKLETNQHSNLVWLLEGGRRQLMLGMYPEYPYMGYPRLRDVAQVRGARFSGRAAMVARVSAPYSIKRDHDIGNKLIVLNREYKPIGCGGKSWAGPKAHYPDFSEHIIEPSAGMLAWMRENLKEIHEDMFWSFYDDCTAPWDARKHTEALVLKIESLIDHLAPGFLDDEEHPDEW